MEKTKKAYEIVIDNIKEQIMNQNLFLDKAFHQREKSQRSLESVGIPFVKR